MGSPPSRNAGTTSGLPAAGVTAPPLPQPAYRRPKRSSAPPAPVSERGASGSLVAGLFWPMVVSAMLACLIQMARKPDNIPAAVGVDTSAAHETQATLKDLGASSKATSWTVNSKAINQYLESSIEMTSADAGVSAISARFQRAFVNLHKGSFTLYVDQKFLGVNLYFILDLEPEKSGAGLGAKPTGGGIGRLPVHPVLMPAFLKLFEPVLAGLSQPLKILRTANSVTITPEDATFQWPGTGKTP
ncbi:MAG: hypothetical protein WCO94_11515 [Verrucomicrobiota bacterium]